jgi:hypothetical protein
MMATSLENLSPKQQKEFERLAEKGAHRSQLEQKLQRNIPNIQKKFSEAMIEFRNTYLGLTINDFYHSRFQKLKEIIRVRKFLNPLMMASARIHG